MYESSPNRHNSSETEGHDAQDRHEEELAWIRATHPEWDAELTEDDRRVREETYLEVIGLFRLALEKWMEQGLTAEEARHMANLELDRISNQTPRE